MGQSSGDDIDSFHGGASCAAHKEEESANSTPSVAEHQELEIRAKKSAAVMTMKEFYETEMGQKLLANPWYARVKDIMERDGYVIKRGDKYFLVRYSPARIFTDKSLNIKREYIIYRINDTDKTGAGYIRSTIRGIGNRIHEWCSAKEKNGRTR